MGRRENAAKEGEERERESGERKRIEEMGGSQRRQLRDLGHYFRSKGRGSFDKGSARKAKQTNESNGKCFWPNEQTDQQTK